MGLGKSKQKPKIYLEMDPVKVQSFDALLESISECMESINQYHNNFYEEIDQIQYYTGLHWYIKDPSFVQALKVFVFTVATAAEKSQIDFKNIVKLHNGPPFIEIDENRFNELTNGLDDFKNVCPHFKNLVRVLIEAPSRLPQIKESIIPVIQKANEMFEKAKEEISSSGMNALEKARSFGMLYGNIGQLNRAPKIALNLLDEIEKTTKDIASINQWIESKEGEQQIKTISQAAQQAKAYKTWEIVRQFWPDKNDLKGSKLLKNTARQEGDKNVGGEKEGEHA